MDGGNSCTTSWMLLILLNCTLKYGYESTFYVKHILSEVFIYRNKLFIFTLLREFSKELRYNLTVNLMLAVCIDETLVDFSITGKKEKSWTSWDSTWLEFFYPHCGDPKMLKLLSWILKLQETKQSNCWMPSLENWSVYHFSKLFNSGISLLLRGFTTLNFIF